MADLEHPNDLRSEIHSAVAKVMGDVSRLEKAGLNAFDKYHFTSIDDFKDHIRPLLAKNGLHISISETGLDVLELENSQGKKKVNCKIGFHITIHHNNGQSLPPDNSTVILPYTGAQTAGIAKSYAIKEWIKGRFLASSGDISEEADMRRQDEFTVQTMSKKEAKPLYEALQRELRAVAIEANSGSLLQWALDNREQLMQLPKDWQDTVREEYVKTLEDIKAAEKLDGMK